VQYLAHAAEVLMSAQLTLWTACFLILYLYRLRLREKIL